MVKTYVLSSRIGLAPLRFKGETLTRVVGNGSTITIFRTEPDRMCRQKYIVTDERRTANGRRTHVDVCQRGGEVAEILATVDPTLARAVLASAGLPDPGVETL